MPTYEYECDSCRRTFEVRQRISEPPLATCEACGGPLRRLLAPAPFILKGDGWYVTDYPSEARKKAMDVEKSSSGTGGAGDKAAADKPDKSDKATSAAKTDGAGGTGATGASSGASTPKTAD